MWKVNFHCPNYGVKEPLISKGLYNHVHLVMDMKEYYYVAAEYMDCTVDPAQGPSSHGITGCLISLPMESVHAFQS